ncbi:hypothetical protein GS399_13120 [Pedobacter sp. HMF7647]|uniref:Aspartyl protease n=1 Tax=Hufsiella arboris TaxID=2695275 RepID=A0A7K1YCU4_9SPHI|nr:aspartyl protease family protein [Hufsiella arboris]MXV51919.1 hypothetical protein [Hufsiella arboris]
MSLKIKHTLTLLILFIGFSASSQVSSVPFTLMESGHIIIKAKVDGVEGKFIFDTGAGLNLFFDKFAKRLKAQQTNNYFTAHRATGESLTVPLYHSESLAIGTLNFSNQLYTTYNIDAGDIDGLISLQPFQNTPVTIDFESKIISFNNKPEVGKSKFIDIQIADYAGKSLDIFTNVKLNDQVTIQVLLDSGAGKSSFWFNSRLMDMLKLDKNSFEVLKKKDEFDATKTRLFYTGKINTLRTENNSASIDNPKSIFVENLIYEGKTGIDWLGKKITISLPDKKIFLID